MGLAFSLGIPIQDGIIVERAKEMTENIRFIDRETYYKMRRWRKAIKYFTVENDQDRQTIEEISGLKFCKLILVHVVIKISVFY